MSNERVRLILVSQYEAMDLVRALGKHPDSFAIENEDGSNRVNAKSIMGVIYAMFDFGMQIFLVNETNKGVFPEELSNLYFKEC